jgi:RHS repeat-associated protein
MALSLGTHDVQVVAQDKAGLYKNSTFRVTVGNQIAYDADGNMTSDGEHMYTWDAANRLVKVSDINPIAGNPLKSTSFAYDGFGRRLVIVEKAGLTVIGTRNFVYNENSVVEERDASNMTQNRFYGLGVQVLNGSTPGIYYYCYDHLGSVRELIDQNGIVRGRYSYNVWGVRTQLEGDIRSDFGYASYLEHQSSGLDLAYFRAYSPKLGKWLSRDPAGEFAGLRDPGTMNYSSIGLATTVHFPFVRGGANLYAYVGGNPISYIDSLGLNGSDGGPTYLFFGHSPDNPVDPEQFRKGVHPAATVAVCTVVVGGLVVMGATTTAGTVTGWGIVATGLLILLL